MGKRRNGHVSVTGSGFTCVPRADVVAAMKAASVVELRRVSDRLGRLSVQLDRVLEGLSPELYAVMGEQLRAVVVPLYDLCGVAGAAHDAAVWPEELERV